MGRGAENRKIAIIKRRGEVGGDGAVRKNSTRIFRGLGTAAPKRHIPLVTRAAKGHRKRSANQSRSEDGDSAAQGTRKILPE
jgi:hypothetical protein